MAAEWGLRGFLDELDEAGELARVTEPVSLREVGGLIDECPQAVLFAEVAGCELPLVANVMASRRRMAVALGVSPTEIRAEIGRRLESPRAPRTVAGGPVKDVRLIGDKANLTLLPIHLQHALDGAPFLSAPMDVTRHPDSGSYNVGVRRLMVRGPRQTGVDVVSPSDLRGAYRRARELGQRLEVAFVVGAHPLDYLATQLRVPCEDEFHLMGALRGEPVPLVACETVDLRVPSDAELVVEGYLEGDWTNLEGPYGEYTGYYGAAHRNPLFEVTAITHRADAIFQTATIGGRNLGHTDTASLISVSTEITAWESVRRAVSQPHQIHCPPCATGMSHVRIALSVRDPGDARNAALAALASAAEIKHAIVVDEDIDVFSSEMVEWALATRFQADRDLTVLPGMRTLPLDPSLPPHDGPEVTTTKLALDATRRRDVPVDAFQVPAPFQGTRPESDGIRLKDVDGLAEQVMALLAEPKKFAELLEALPRVHTGDLVRALDRLRARSAVTMDPAGRYQTPAQAVSPRGPAPSQDRRPVANRSR